MNCLYCCSIEVETGEISIKIYIVYFYYSLFSFHKYNIHSCPKMNDFIYIYK